MEETIAMAMFEMTSSIKEMASSMVSTTSKKANVTIGEGYEEMMTIPDLQKQLRLRVIEVFANNAINKVLNIEEDSTSKVK